MNRQHEWKRLTPSTKDNIDWSSHATTKKGGMFFHGPVITAAPGIVPLVVVICRGYVRDSPVPYPFGDHLCQ